MITIDLGNIEYFDGIKNEFIYEDGGVARFEYSLKAIYKWESQWKKPFLKGNLTREEWDSFYRIMALDDFDNKFMTDDVREQLVEYINEPQTATRFNNPETSQNGNKTPSRGKFYTAEEIYALMFMAGVDIEFENRNVNRLLVILSIISSYNSPPKKMTKQEIYKQNAELNAKRKMELKTRG